LPANHGGVVVYVLLLNTDLSLLVEKYGAAAACIALAPLAWSALVAAAVGLHTLLDRGWIGSMEAKTVVVH
jgi:hypothetical protein